MKNIIHTNTYPNSRDNDKALFSASFYLHLCLTVNLIPPCKDLILSRSLIHIM